MTTTETIHHLPSKVGVLIGKEISHGTKATSINLVIGRGAVFAENVSENQNEIYDPACGQALQEVIFGVKDTGGGLNFQLIDWKWLSWTLGTDLMNEIFISDEVGTFANGDNIEGASFTATISSRTGDILTLTNITGTPIQGETIDDVATGNKTATLKAFIHDISLGDNPQSLTIVNIFDTINESEDYIGMRISEASFVSSRGDPISVDLTLVGINESTNSSPETRICTSKTSWIWSTGSINLNSVILDNVCDSVSIKIMRNCVARGGHNRIPHEVVPGQFKVEVTIDMDLPSSAIRILRRAGTKINLILTYINVTNQEQATLTFTNLQILSDPRDTSKDAETVRVSVVGVTGNLTGRVYDDIFAH